MRRGLCGGAKGLDSDETVGAGVGRLNPVSVKLEVQGPANAIQGRRRGLPGWGGWEGGGVKRSEINRFCLGDKGEGGWYPPTALNENVSC